MTESGYCHIFEHLPYAISLVHCGFSWGKNVLSLKANIDISHLENTLLVVYFGKISPNGASRLSQNGYEKAASRFTRAFVAKRASFPFYSRRL